MSPRKNRTLIQHPFICPFCRHVSNEFLIRCDRCEKLSHLIVLLTGPALSMKSVIAYYLHRNLKIGLIESAYLGPALNDRGITDELLRQKRRSKLLQILDVYSTDKLPVIVDGAFHRRKDRVAFLRILESKYRHMQIMIVCCISTNDKIREYRRIDRASQAESFEIEPLSQEEAKRLLQEYDEPFEDVLPGSGKKVPIVFVNTDTFTVKVLNIHCQKVIAKEIHSIKETLIKGIAVGKI